MTHPDTGEVITQYKKLAKDPNPIVRDTWMTGLGKEFGRMAQGDTKTGTKGTNCIHVMTHAEISNIPLDRVVTYARIVVDYRPQKEDPNRVRITAGGNLIKYQGNLLREPQISPLRNFFGTVPSVLMAHATPALMWETST